MTDDPLHDSGQAGRLPHEVDRRLRETFEPDGTAIARVVAAAASGEVPRRRRRRRPLRLAWAAVAVLAVAIATTAYWRAGIVAQPEPRGVVLSGSFTNDVLILSAPDGSVSLTGPGFRDDRPQDGSGIVLVEGDLK
jgi:hypothetical protein